MKYDKKTAVIYVRVTPQTKKKWDALVKKAKVSQNELFRRVVWLML